MSLGLGVLVLAAACSSRDGSDGAPGPDPPTSTIVARGESPPGLVVTVQRVRGGSGPGGAFLIGDHVTVDFTVVQEDGGPWGLSELVGGEALVSGPTRNYQRVLPVRDVLGTARARNDGSFTYRFDEPLPATYAPAYNDTPSYGPVDGDRGGLPLEDGTYTLGLWFAWDYTVLGHPFRDVGEATFDFLVGSAPGPLEPRDVVRSENCDTCHVGLRAHDGRHRNLAMCLLCHTSGAEDLNDPSIEGGTPGVSIDSRVLFHALHNGRYLPSVLGIGTRDDGSRDFARPPRPYRIVDGDGAVHDYSEVGWPGMPNRILPMPEDVGYSALSAAEMALDDRVRSGVVACDACHGDPDGDGPLEAPRNGDNAYFMQTRRACGACHDDVDFALPYVANNQEMPEQLDDTGCFFCHDSRFPGALSPIDGHVNPLALPSFFPGLEIEILELAEAGSHDDDGTIDPGEKIRVTFTVEDESGAEVDASELDALRVLVTGPTRGPQTVLVAELPTQVLAGPQPYAGNLPWQRALEHAGDSTASTGDVFVTRFAPHVGGPDADTRVRVRSGTSGGATVLSAPLARHQNFVDVANPSGFARGDHVVVDDGVPGLEEYFEVFLVDGSRLWFSSPNRPLEKSAAGLDHTAGSSALEVQLVELVRDVDYGLDAISGTLTELVELGAGTAVLVDYTTHFVFPSEYGPQLNESPGLSDATGKWTGKNIEDGTYRLGLSAYVDMEAFAMGELTPYRASSTPATRAFRVGGALGLDPYRVVESGETCNACHRDLTHHDGRDRGYETCLLCHGTAGAEDLPRYAAPGAPATDGVSVAFETLLHRIHRGRELRRPHEVVGESPSGGFEVVDFATHAFPPDPGRTSHCAKCHTGDPDSIYPREDRNHASEQATPVLAWTLGCTSCHDSVPAEAHVESHTSPAGLEACALCHGPGEVEDVELVHRPR